jgi:hypothetical protein
MADTVSGRPFHLVKMLHVMGQTVYCSMPRLRMRGWHLSSCRDALTQCNHPAEHLTPFGPRILAPELFPRFLESNTSVLQRRNLTFW